MDNFLLQSKTAVTWSTEGISRRERFDYWSDVVCQGICKLECRRFANTPFYGKLRYARFGEIDLLEMESEPQIFLRTKSHLSEITDHTMVLSLPLTQRSEKALNTNGLCTSRGDISFYDATRPQKLAINSQIQALIIQIPKPLLENHLINVERYDSSVISTHTLLGQLTSSLLQTLAANLDRESSRGTASVTSTLMQLIAFALTERTEQRDIIQYRAAVHTSLRQTIEQFIKTNCCDTNLSPKLIADRYRISLRYLHRLFEDSEYSVAKTILNARLQQAMELLCRCDQKFMVTQVAFQCGFKDVSHFSKSFKDKYGVNPRDVNKMDACVIAAKRKSLKV